MPKDSSIPIRLDTETKKRLKEAAERVGLSSSTLIRILIVSFIRHFETSGGRRVLPLEWNIAECEPVTASASAPVASTGKKRHKTSRPAGV